MADQSNLQDATTNLNLNDQEQYLYSKHLSNLWGEGGVTNAPTETDPNWSRSTLYASVEPHDGKFSVIPTIWDGKRETEPWTRPDDGKVFDIPNSTALANVDKEGWDKYPSYNTPKEAEDRYLSMHDYMEKDTQSYFSSANLGD